MADQIVPLAVAPNQQFAVQLIVNGKPLTLLLTCSYSEMAGYWQLSITNVQGLSLVGSVPLVTGWYPAANVLAQYQYLLIGSAYLLNTGNADTDYPGPTSLDRFSLLWGDNV